MPLGGAWNSQLLPSSCLSLPEGCEDRDRCNNSTRRANICSQTAAALSCRGFEAPVIERTTKWPHRIAHQNHAPEDRGAMNVQQCLDVGRRKMLWDHCTCRLMQTVMHQIRTPLQWRTHYFGHIPLLHLLHITMQHLHGHGDLHAHNMHRSQIATAGMTRARRRR